MPYNAELDKNYDHVVTANSHPKVKTAITPGVGDIIHDTFGYPKAVAVHVTGGGRASITYVATRNDDGQTVTVEVADGWVSETGVRRVTALSAIDGGAVATVWGLYS